MMNTRIVTGLALAGLILPPPANGQGSPDAPEPYVYRAPERIADGWEVADLREVGVDLGLLSHMVREIREQSLPNLHSVLIVKDGKLVFEEYFEGTDEQRGRNLGTIRFDRATLHDLRSVTKSVTGALVGIAQGGEALDVSQGVLALFPEHTDLDPPKDEITLVHLLTMTSGLEWDERTYPYTDPRNSETAMDLSASSVRYVLEQDLLSEPGERFGYCGGCTMVLAGAIREATGSNLDDYAREVLFEPLGITEFEWLHHADGLPIAASGLRLRPRDMAKIGYLYANEGRWGEREIIPAAWIRESFEPQFVLDSATAYTYQWWLDYEGSGPDRFPVLVARGNGGTADLRRPEARPGRGDHGGKLQPAGRQPRIRASVLALRPPGRGTRARARQRDPLRPWPTTRRAGVRFRRRLTRC